MAIAKMALFRLPSLYNDTDLPEVEPSQRVLGHSRLNDLESMIWPPAFGSSYNSAKKKVPVH